VRILLGDPDSQVVADRGDDEGIGDTVPAKVRNALALYRPLRQVEGVEFRLHRTVLYNSIYRADDEVLVNTHVFGLAAAQARPGTCVSSRGASWPACISTASSGSGKRPRLARKELGEYSVDRSMRLRIEHYVEGRAGPCLG
jgi:hypothetical protein